MKLVYIVFIFVLYIFIVYQQGYQHGYKKAQKDLELQWLEAPEGVCLGDTPPHIGNCRNG